MKLYLTGLKIYLLLGIRGFQQNSNVIGNLKFDFPEIHPVFSIKYHYTFYNYLG